MAWKNDDGRLSRRGTYSDAVGYNINLPAPGRGDVLLGSRNGDSMWFVSTLHTYHTYPP